MVRHILRGTALASICITPFLAISGAILQNFSVACASIGIAILASISALIYNVLETRKTGSEVGE